ncbi:MAG TPA: type II toxin-antitoxin system HicB family antitoxin [Solirubrobacterales bacterium]|nr:type II toxin-antitoxin system HicB family antitoxin [Solirubrobacterales bacterium]
MGRYCGRSSRSGKRAYSGGDHIVGFANDAADEDDLGNQAEAASIRGRRIYAPDLPGLHTQGDDLDDAMENAGEAVALYVEGLREDGEPLGSGVIRRKIPLPA